MDNQKLSRTPLKRLGLSRKSSPVMKPSLIKVSPASMERGLSVLNGSNTTPQRIRSPLHVKRLTPLVAQPLALTDDDLKKKIDHLTELKKKLSQAENVGDLKNIVEVWKAGCKEALLSLRSCIIRDENITLSYKTLGTQLGISVVLFEHFENDPELLD